MASFGLGFDVAEPPEISSNDVDILNDIFPKILCFWRLMSTSTYEAQQELKKNFFDDRKEAMQSN